MTKATLIIEQRGQGYIYDLFSDRATKRGVRCGLTPLEAATEATKILASLAQSTGQSTGAAIVAPPEVLAHIPAHLIDADAEPSNKAVRIKALELMADLLIAIYKEPSKIPLNVERYAQHNPLQAIGLITQRHEMPRDNQDVAEIMDKINNPDDLNFSRPAGIEEQGVFNLRLYKSPYRK